MFVCETHKHYSAETAQYGLEISFNSFWSNLVPRVSHLASLERLDERPGNEVDFDRNEEKIRKSKYRLRTCEQKAQTSTKYLLANALLETGRNVLA